MSIPDKIVCVAAEDRLPKRRAVRNRNVQGSEDSLTYRETTNNWRRLRNIVYKTHPDPQAKIFLPAI